MKAIEIQDFASVTIGANCNITLLVGESSGRESIAKIKNPDTEAITVTHSIKGNELIIDVCTSDSPRAGTSAFFVAIQEAFKKDSIKGLMGNISDGMKNNVRDHNDVLIELRIPQGFSAIAASSTNMNVELRHSLVRAIDINSPNLDFKMLMPMVIENLMIKSSNADIHLIASHGLGMATIHSENCDVFIKRNDGFEGRIDVSGENIDVSGKQKGDPEKGLITCIATNADVIIK